MLPRTLFETLGATELSSKLIEALIEAVDVATGAEDVVDGRRLEEEEALETESVGSEILGIDSVDGVIRGREIDDAETVTRGIDIEEGVI